MPGLIINGEQEPVAGLAVRSWFDDPALRLRIQKNCQLRRADTVVRGIVLHTTKGWPDRENPAPMKVLPGLGPRGMADRTVRSWLASPRPAGAHLVVDSDGSVVCCADLAREAAYHATVVNEVTIGIEIYQGGKAELYDGQLDATVTLVDHLTRRFAIQRQIPRRYRGHPVPRLAAGGGDVVGVYGHRDVTDNRGASDPGDPIFAKLAAAGYERFAFEDNEDLATWQARAASLGLDNPWDAAPGVAGRRLATALARSGRPRGLWVARPGD